MIYYLPMHELAARALLAGELPGWNPFQFAGSPLLATAQPAPFYPLEAIFLALPAYLANNVYVVCNLCVAALGTFFFARRLTSDAAGACVAALAFSSSGFMYGQIAHQSVVAAVAWLPWALLGIERLRTGIEVGRVVALAAPLTASFLAGQPQMSLLVVVVLFLYTATHVLLRETRTQRLLKRGAAALGFVLIVEIVAPRVWQVEAPALFLWVVVLAVLAVALFRALAREREPRMLFWSALLGVAAAATAAAIQLLPTAMIVSDTSRSSFSFDDATSFSFPASHIVLFLFPQLFGSSQNYHGQFNLTELSAYPGAAALVLAAAGLTRARRDARFLALCAAAALAFVAALGKTTMLAPLIWGTPILGHFRSWGRYAVVVDLAVAVGAAFGVAELRSRAGGAVRRAAVAAALLTASALLIPLVPRVAHFASSGGQRVLALLPPIAAAIAAVGCAALFRSQPTLAAAACAIVVVVDGLISFGVGSELATSPSVARVSAVYSPARAASWGRLVPVSGGMVRYLYLGEKIEPAQPYLPQATALKGMRSVNGYDPLAPRAYLSAVGMRQDGSVDHPNRLLERPRWTLDLLRVSTVLVPVSGLPRVISPRYRRLGVAHGIARFRYVPRLPEAFLVGRAREATHQVAAATIRSTRFDPRREVLLEGCNGCGSINRAGGAGVVVLRTRTRGSILLTVAAQRAAALVISEAWFPGWHATVDEHQTEVMRADGILIGLLIPPGRHQVRLKYVAPGEAAGLAISATLLLAFATFPAVGLLRLMRRFPRDNREDVE